VSGPIIFNTAVALGEYLNSQKIRKFFEENTSELSHDERIAKYIRENIVLKIDFLKSTQIPKRIGSFFSLSGDRQEISLPLQDYRTWKEAKITGG